MTDTHSLDALGDWRRTHSSTGISKALDGKSTTFFGWVEDIRDLGGLVFLTLRDREGTAQITIVRKKASQQILDKVRDLGRQYALGVRGKIRASEEAPKGVEIIPEEIRILGEAVHPLPLDPTGRVPADIDVRLNNRVLDLRRPETRAIFTIASRILGETRRFLAGQDFVEVRTPKIIATATEGGASLFPVEYFENKAYLSQSPELYKEELVTVFEKVMEIGPAFRAEESQTRRHLNEVTMVDVEQAFATADDIMTLQEKLLAHLIEDLRKTMQRELELLNVKLETAKIPLKRYTYEQVLSQLEKRGVKIPFGEDIGTEAYRTLGELHQKEYYFIVDWPTSPKPFYIKPMEDHPSLCHAFDFMYEMLEITSGGSRVDRKEVLVQRLKEQGLDPEDFKHHLAVYDWGFPPHAGFGMGLERLLMALLALENIREASLFPRDRYRLTP